MRFALIGPLLVAMFCLQACAANPQRDEQSAMPLEPFGAVPTQAQHAWHRAELHAFVHFTVTTFTNQEWGYGDEDPAIFNPTEFDAREIVQQLKVGGFTGVILTAKHHDGFCLWPTETTDHNISASPYKDGNGDLVRELADACAAEDLKFGVYLSPWDRHDPRYGSPAYLNEVYRPQLRELLSNYGDIFEVWFDGANGGDGYYGGARETRSIDRTTYYDWPTTWAMVRELQPNAIMFSDVGPDCRWVGNERGFAAETSWSTITYPADAAPGQVDQNLLPVGTRLGERWIPAECDVSIRPGWFYHPAEDDRVKTPAELMELYVKSVGRGATFLLNVPPMPSGKLHPADIESLRQFGEHMKAIFETNLAADATPTATNERPVHPAGEMLDRDDFSYWATDDGVLTPCVELQLTGEQTFNLVRLEEAIALGQRVGGVAVDAWIDGNWQELCSAESVGHARIWRIEKFTTDRVRLRVTESAASPAIASFGLFLEPAMKNSGGAGTGID